MSIILKLYYASNRSGFRSAHVKEGFFICRGSGSQRIRIVGLRASGWSAGHICFCRALLLASVRCERREVLSFVVFAGLVFGGGRAIRRTDDGNS